MEGGKKAFQALEVWGKEIAVMNDKVSQEHEK